MDSDETETGVYWDWGMLGMGWSRVGVELDTVMTQLFIMTHEDPDLNLGRIMGTSGRYNQK